MTSIRSIPADASKLLITSLSALVLIRLIVVFLHDLWSSVNLSADILNVDALIAQVRDEPRSQRLR